MNGKIVGYKCEDPRDVMEALRNEIPGVLFEYKTLEKVPRECPYWNEVGEDERE